MTDRMNRAAACCCSRAMHSCSTICADRVRLVQGFIAAAAPPCWQGAQVSGGQLRKFTAAQLGGGNVVHSAEHMASSHASCYAPVSVHS